MATTFKVSAGDAMLIAKITDRAYRMATDEGEFDPLDLMMSITAVHANGCPLRLADLLVADDFNFAHDVFGIGRHVDTKNGKLRNHFLPRFARPKGVSDA